MNALVTGSSGLVGSEVLRFFAERGCGVVPYDLAEGRDILDRVTLQSAMAGCDLVVHSAALVESPGDGSDSLRRVNVTGTANVLAAAEAQGVGRVVFISSLSVLGVFKGHRDPDYLPLDADHACHASTEYELCKLEAEGLCSLATESGALSIVSLRSPGVWNAETYIAIQAARQADPTFEWQPYWEYGAFLDVRDLAWACWAAASADVEGHVILNVASSDISTSGRSSHEWARALHPDVEWRGDESYRDQPFQSLVSIDEARRILDWEPAFTWERFVASTTDGMAS